MIEPKRGPARAPSSSTSISEAVRIASASLLFTWLFFVEYLPPLKKVHLWSDIDGYHYPLLNYIHKSLRDGRFPLWDPSIYSGLSFVGNIQAGLFYPPNWILFLTQAGRDGLLFISVEALAIGHVSLASILTYLWLCSRSTHWIPPIMGAAVAAYGGYLMSQLNHLGAACGYAWMPLGLWGIDQASRSRSWRPLWKLSLASALCLLAGYPPTWVAFSIVATVYAIASPGGFRLLPRTVCALAFALALGAVQLLPSLEIAKLKVPEFRYGGPMPDSPLFYLSFLFPNYYDQNRLTRGPDFIQGDYMYLGVPALFALLYLLKRPRIAGALPAAVVAGACLLIIENPLGILERVVNSMPVAPDVLRSYNLLIGLPLSAALLTASALDDFLSRPAAPGPAKGLMILWMVVAAAWSAHLVWLWPRGGWDFAAGLWSGVYSLVLLLLFCLGIAFYRSTTSKAVVIMLFVTIFLDYKAFGTNRKFNAVTGSLEEFYKGDARIGGQSLMGLNDDVYRYLLKHPMHRIVIVDGPHSTDMRHYGLTTPQGFDPFLPRQYREAIEKFVPFRTDRLFDVDPLNEAFLKQFGVRFVMVRESAAAANALNEHSRFRLLQPSDGFFQVYEYLHAEPPWRFPGRAAVAHWEPERRVFSVDSSAGGRFVLLEQFWPGWRAFVDGKSVPIERWDGAFQSIRVSGGPHSIEFIYRPRSVYAGAGLSLLSSILLAVFIARSR